MKKTDENPRKKISVRLTPENSLKAEDYTSMTGKTISDFVNECCRQANIIILGRNSEVAKAFIQLANAINQNQNEEIQKGVDILWQFTESILAQTKA